MLAKFFKVHPGYLVDDLEDMPHAPMRPRRGLDDRLDLWLIEGSQEFADDARLSEALLQIAKHPKSRECLIVFGSIVENRELIERLIDRTDASAVQKQRKRRGT